MITLGILVKRSDEVAGWYLKMIARLSEKNIVKNPFFGQCERYENKKEDSWLILLGFRPVYIILDLYGLMLAIILYFLLGWSWWLLIPVPFLLTAVFRTSWFYYAFCRIGMRKLKVNSKVQKLSKDEIFEIVIGPQEGWKRVEA